MVNRWTDTDAHLLVNRMWNKSEYKIYYIRDNPDKESYIHTAPE